MALNYREEKEISDAADLFGTLKDRLNDALDKIDELEEEIEGLKAKLEQQEQQQ